MMFAPITVGSYVCPSEDGVDLKVVRALEQRLVEDQSE